ncbi:MAG: glycosyltransferase family 2 protein [Actinobacteria bacterium]|nr:glycosyltransferase family 2 protein [Actinomycetota bacterium]
MVRASLIVLNWQGTEVIAPCLDSLLKASHERDEVIVVDNASTDGSREYLQTRDDIRLVELDENAFIFGLNLGLAAARGEYVAFLNNDIVVEPDFVDACVLGFSAGDDVFAVCPRILEQSGLDQGSRTAATWHRGILFYRVLPHSNEPTDCFFAVGGQSFFRRKMLQQIGSIDPLFWPMYHEDIELSYRAWKRGWRVRYAPDAIVHHHGGHSSQRAFTRGQLRSFVRQNEYLTVWKNVHDPRLLFEHLMLMLPRLAVAAARGDWPTLVGFGRAASRARAAIRARRRASVHARLSDRETLSRITQIP